MRGRGRYFHAAILLGVVGVSAGMVRSLNRDLPARLAMEHPTLLALRPTPTPHKSESVGVDVEEVLRKVAGRYASITYYKSRGITRYRTTFDGEETEKNDVAFRIEYRSGGSRVEWKVKEQSNVLLLQEEKGSLWVNGKLIEEYPTRPSPITLAARGFPVPKFEVSRFFRASAIEDSSSLFSGFANVKLIGDRMQDGRECFLIGGYMRNVDDAIRIYWFDKQDLLLRRFDQELVVRATRGRKEYVHISRVSETYSDIEAR